MVAIKSKGLGKGLSALMADDYSNISDPSVESNVASANKFTQNEINIDLLCSGKYQPRNNFSEEYLGELAESIKKNGIMQPIIVRKSPNNADKYEIIAGERRWRAARLAGLSEVPIVERLIDDKQALELALVENIQREDLTSLEEAAGYQRLIDEFGYKHDELSEAVGKSRSHIANLLRLLSLPDEIKELLNDGKISMGHARALLNVKNSIELALEVVEKGLNVRQTERLGRPEPKNSKPNNKSPKSGGGYNINQEKDPDIIALEQTLSDNLGLNVSINDNGQNGQIVISYDSLSQLDSILKRLAGNI